jgi:hypothetical protein
VTETISPMPEQIDAQQLAQQLVERARAEGVDLVGPGGLLAGLTKTVLETALDAEMSEHVGYDKHDPAGRNGQNSRNGTRSKTVLTEVGPVEIEVPRDRDGSFEPVIVRKRQRRLDGIDQIVLSLTARGLTTGEVAAHFAEVYGAKVSKDTISRITEPPRRVRRLSSLTIRPRRGRAVDGSGLARVRRVGCRRSVRAGGGGCTSRPIPARRSRPARRSATGRGV